MIAILAALVVALGLGAAGAPPALAADGAGTAGTSGTHGGMTQCLDCHDCAKPSPDDPCLRECLRHTIEVRPSDDWGPDVVVLDELVDLYVPVRFDHRTHAKMTRFSGDCSFCHHFSPEGDDHPACSSCHPADVPHENLSQPGLKGAYHRQCLGCHVEWDTATRCEVCHEKRAGGRLQGEATEPTVHRFYEPIPIEEVILFETGYEDGDVVPFHHRNHATLYEADCGVCHHDQSCSRCHVHGTGGMGLPPDQLHPMGEPDETDLHDACFGCHDAESDASHPQDDCDTCHGRDPDDLFTHADTGWPLASYHEGVGCRRCHGGWPATNRLSPRCEGCHPDGPITTTARHGLVAEPLDETHADADCTDCHTAANGGGRVLWSYPPTCDSCHDDIVWEPGVRIGGS